MRWETDGREINAADLLLFIAIVLDTGKKKGKKVGPPSHTPEKSRYANSSPNSI